MSHILLLPVPRSQVNGDDNLELEYISEVSPSIAGDKSAHEQNVIEESQEVVPSWAQNWLLRQQHLPSLLDQHKQHQ